MSLHVSCRRSRDTGRKVTFDEIDVKSSPDDKVVENVSFHFELFERI